MINNDSHKVKKDRAIVQLQETHLIEERNTFLCSVQSQYKSDSGESYRYNSKLYNAYSNIIKLECQTFRLLRLHMFVLKYAYRSFKAVLALARLLN